MARPRVRGRLCFVGHDATEDGAAVAEEAPPAPPRPPQARAAGTPRGTQGGPALDLELVVAARGPQPLGHPKVRNWRVFLDVLTDTVAPRLERLARLGERRRTP